MYATMLRGLFNSKRAASLPVPRGYYACVWINSHGFNVFQLMYLAGNSIRCNRLCHDLVLSTLILWTYGITHTHNMKSHDGVLSRDASHIQSDTQAPNSFSFMFTAIPLFSKSNYLSCLLAHTLSHAWIPVIWSYTCLEMYWY